MLPDENVLSVIEQMTKRMAVGYEKYGTTTERTDIDFLGWLQHLQEELMDATVYIERLKKEINNEAIK
jgi:hypothetical protein